MRVLVVHNRYRSEQPSGENAVVDDEIHLLAEHGCDVQRVDVSSDEIATWPAWRRAALPARVVWSLDGHRLVRAAIQGFRPDVVHFHNTFPLLSPSALWAARSSGAGVVHTLHNFRPLCPAATFFRDGGVCEECLGRTPWPALRHGCYRGSRAATAPLVAMDSLHRALGTWKRCVDTFVTPSEFTRRKYVAAGWPPSRLEVKYNTVPDGGTPRLGPGNGFVCVSRLGPEKGIELLLDAWRIAFPRGEAQLTIVGSGPSEQAIRRRAAGLQGVEFEGQVDRRDALQAIGRARAILVPSRCYEGFPRVVAEAYSVGVPVIASRLGALEEIVEDRRTGLLVDPASVDGLAQALLDLAGSDELSSRLGRGARAAYEQKLAGAPTTQRLIDLYHAAAAGRDHGSTRVRPTGASLGDVKCHLRDNLESELYYLGSYAAPEIAKVARYLEPRDVFLDVGAHLGLFSVEIARHVGRDGKVLAFEPSVDSALTLRRNAEANGVAGTIEVVEIALGDHPGKLPLRVAPQHPFDAGRRSLFADGPVVSHVSIRALDDLVDAAEITLDRGLHAVKIDVEGNEAAVIRGMRRTLVAHRPRVVLVEAVDANLRRAGSSRAELIELMRGVGYQPDDGGYGDGSLDITFVPEVEER